MENLTLTELIDAFYKKREFRHYVNHFLKNKQDLENLVAISLQADKGKYCINGTWLCAHIAAEDPSIFARDIKKIVHFLTSEQHQSSLRNWMKVITFLPIPEEIEGEIIDLCIAFIQNPKNKVALQMYAILTLLPIVKKYPELIPEIKAIIDVNSEGKSPAYQAISRKFESFTKNI